MEPDSADSPWFETLAMAGVVLHALVGCVACAVARAVVVVGTVAFRGPLYPLRD